MQLSTGQLIRVTCTNVLDYPHDGIVSVGYGAAYVHADAAGVLAAVRVIHFCRGDPAQRSFPDGAGPGDPLSHMLVRETSLAWFVSQGRDACIVAGPPSQYTPEQVVQRARQLLGADCQSFATHCYYGVAHSEAVRRAGMWLAGGLVVLAATVYAAAPWM
jgi:hypothetical protein